MPRRPHNFLLALAAMASVASTISCKDAAQETGNQPRLFAIKKIKANDAPSASSSGMLCYPLGFSSDQAISIALPNDHGQSMMINTPDGRSLSIAWDGDNPGGAGPPFAGQQFLQLEQLSLNRNSMGFDSAQGRNVRIFETPGEYEVIVGETLDVCDPIPQGYCRVRYLG